MNFFNCACLTFGLYEICISFLLLMNYCGSLNVKKIITKFVPTSITQVTNGRKTNELQKGCSFKTPFSNSVSESNALHIIYYCLGFRNKGYFQWLPNTYHQGTYHQSHFVILYKSRGELSLLKFNQFQNFLLVSLNLPKNQRNFFQDFYPSFQKEVKSKKQCKRVKIKSSNQ